MCHADPTTRPGAPADARHGPSAAADPPRPEGDPLADLAALLAISLRTVARIEPAFVTEKLGALEDDLPSALEFESAERERTAGLELLAMATTASSGRGALLHVLLALEEADNLSTGDVAADRCLARRRARIRRLLYSVAYFLAGPDPDRDARTLLDRYAPSSFHVTAQLERLQAA